MHIHGTRIEVEVEIYATNLANKQSPEYKCMELNGEFFKTYSAYFYHHAWSKT